MNIKFKLVKFEKALVFQILEQTKYTPKEINDATIPLRIKILECPQLTETAVYLRGENEVKNETLRTINFYNNKERDSYYKKVIETIKTWSIIDEKKDIGKSSDIFCL